MYRLTQDFRVRFWGTRGSIPAPGPGTVKYGGNTACVEVRCGEELIILDAGTGIKELGTKLLKETPLNGSILFSHMHWDHIQGIPFFRPLYAPGNGFRLYGSKSWDARLEYALRWQMRSPSFPLTFEDLSTVGAKMEYVDITAGKAFKIGKNGQVTVQSIELNHPDKAFGFRIEYNGRSIVYATDNESLPHPDEKLVELAHETDLLIHDAQYTKEEYYGMNGSSKKDWGHSTPEAAAEVARASKAKKLVLFHHDPYHDDSKVDQMLEEVSAIFPDTVAASEDMVLVLNTTMAPADSSLARIDRIGSYPSISEAL